MKLNLSEFTEKKCKKPHDIKATNNIGIQATESESLRLPVN